MVCGLLIAVASLVMENGLQGMQASAGLTDSAASWHVSSSQTRDRTQVAYISRQILYQ